jgi:hypothetical protein
MRNHNCAVLLRLTEKEFLILKQRANEFSLTRQEFLRDLLRYGRLEIGATIVDKKSLK